MLHCGQDSTLNPAEHGFFAQITYNYGHIVSFARFYLMTISQHGHHASVQNNIEIGLLDQL